MSLLVSFIATITHARNQTLKLVADLSDQQMCYQPAPKTNHPAWVLGHLLSSEYMFLSLIGGSPIPAWIDAEYRATYGGNSQPVADKSKYKPKSFYIEKLTAAREQIIARLKQMKDEDFAAPHPDPARRERFPTIGHMVMLYGTWHEAYHSGQLSAWRRVQGLPAV
ncbi:MAG: DinB family protein [Phycisphaerales bacterium]|nr:DinB family protein [Phycisphaerales bacterium]